MSDKKKETKKEECSTEKNSCCKSELCKKVCKILKYFPHNWLNLRVLSVIFGLGFYALIIFLITRYVKIYDAYSIGLIQNSSQAWDAVLGDTIGIGLYAITLVTFSHITCALAKIKKAAAPCCKDKK